MVEVGTGGKGTRFLKTRWPIDEGITAGTTKLKRRSKLEPEESIISDKDKVML